MSKRSDRIRLLVAATSPMTVRAFMRGQLSYMNDKGLEVHILCGTGLSSEDIANEGVSKVWAIPLKRTPSPLRDAVALMRTILILLRLRPHIVNAGTPKAALLVLVAAKLTRVPVRIYTLHGLRLETSTGMHRSLLKFAEWITASCAHRIIAVSPSLAELYTQYGLGPSSKLVVLGDGSTNGVDCLKFTALDTHAPNLLRLRDKYDIPHDAPILGFVGRLTPDKGISDLLHAFREISKRHPGTRLLLVGGEEDEDSLSSSESSYLDGHDAIIAVGHVANTAAYYNLMDVLILPTKREGFPNVVLEASACGIPTIAYRATGSVDAIREGATGRLVPQGDVKRLVEAASEYLANRALRQRHGANARSHVIEHFRPESVWIALYNQYRNLAGPRRWSKWLKNL